RRHAAIAARYRVGETASDTHRGDRIWRHADRVSAKKIGGKRCASGGTVNNVASFLPNLPARSSAVSQGPRGDSEALKNSHGEGDGFDAVLSGFSEHSPSGKPTANAAAPAHS